MALSVCMCYNINTMLLIIIQNTIQYMLCQHGISMEHPIRINTRWVDGVKANHVEMCHAALVATKLVLSELFLLWVVVLERWGEMEISATTKIKIQGGVKVVQQVRGELGVVW